MFRILVRVYAAVSIAMIATSLITGHRATALSGKPHYLLTRTTVPVEEYVPPDNPSDAAFEAAQRDAGESPALGSVDKPCFVLGLADATGPVVLIGAFIVLIGAWWSRRKRHKPAVAQTGPPQV
jgi:hypothetical protein